MVRHPGKLILDRYRRAGADPPFSDPARDHGGRFEGYYWRFTDRTAGRVVIALCGLTRSAGERWAVTAVASHPGGVVREAILRDADADRRGFGVDADGAAAASDAVEGAAIAGSDRELRVTLGPGESLRARIEGPRPFPRRALGSSGIAQLAPGLPQYWQPHLMGGRARVELRIGAEEIALDGATTYLEKNWGSAFPARWWWGQADDFEDDACVAFAGGPVTIAGASISPTLAALRLGDRFVTLAPPLARTAAAVGEQGWRIRIRTPRYAVELDGDDPATSAVALPVPRPDRVATYPGSHQALAGRMRVLLRRGRRTLFRGESRLAGLEHEREPA